MFTELVFDVGGLMTAVAYAGPACLHRPLLRTARALILWSLRRASRGTP
jgi:hypothetical protein